ncbi:MAG: hypothetical protein JW891_07945 [Candidatus Lokiarchaeota archaeon]|nr:hypothetical protein [Candidatus Lokiarchaeota archaeon]
MNEKHFFCSILFDIETGCDNFNLTIPSYIEKANVMDVNIYHIWEDYIDLEDLIGPVEKELIERIQKLSRRAAYSLLLASSEWIFHRFDLIIDDALPLHAIEVNWAQVVDKHYAIRWYAFERKEMLGPVRGPLWDAIIIVMDEGDILWYDQDQSFYVGRMLKLAEHVIPNKKIFIEWRNAVMNRLLVSFPLSKEDPFGPPVPREAFDPERAFDLSEIESLINNYLEQLDPEDNDFLNTPDEMIQAGFEGTPCIFNLKQDFEWRTKLNL